MLKHKVPGSRKVLAVMGKNTKYTNQGSASESRANFEAGRYSDAIKDFTIATKIIPEYAEAYCHRANARIMLIHKTPQN